MTSKPESGRTGISSADTVTQENVSLAINGFLMAEKAMKRGDESAAAERQRQLRIIQGRYWRLFQSVISGAAAGKKHGLEFSEDERLLLDAGLVDPRMLGEDRDQAMQELLEELNFKGPPGGYYLSEWLAHLHQQFQLESALTPAEDAAEDYVSQLGEARRRVLSRLSEYFTGLPGIPLEVSESMRGGELDSALLAACTAAMQDPRRKTFLRRRSLWQLREQILAKARARTSSQNTLRLFEMLNEIYVRDWRERYEAYLSGGAKSGSPGSTDIVSFQDSISVGGGNIHLLMSEVRQIRMRMVLMDCVDGLEEPDIVLYSRAPRLTKRYAAEFIGTVQPFDRFLSDLPPILFVPGSGRGFFSWETGCVMLALRPLVSADDSIATAFAWRLMLEDRFSRDEALRKAYEQKFPGAVFQNEFPADYRAWLTRLTRGEAGAMHTEKRTFFRDHIGPDISGPLLPPNLRSVGPQTMSVICRRLEKQLASGENDANFHRRLAAIYWQQGNFEAAGLQFNAAMQMAPDDGETMFAAGLFLRGQDSGDAANDCFRFGAERAGNTMWGIYCQDALAGQL